MGGLPPDPEPTPEPSPPPRRRRRRKRESEERTRLRREMGVGLQSQSHAAGPDFDKVKSKVGSHRSENRSYKPKAARVQIFDDKEYMRKVKRMHGGGEETKDEGTSQGVEMTDRARFSFK